MDNRFEFEADLVIQLAKVLSEYMKLKFYFDDYFTTLMLQ